MTIYHGDNNGSVKAPFKTKIMTAVEWLFEQVVNRTERIYFLKELEQAKEMEKEQIEQAFDDGYAKCGITHNAQEYYNETFKNTNK